MWPSRLLLCTLTAWGLVACRRPTVCKAGAYGDRQIAVRNCAHDCFPNLRGDRSVEPFEFNFEQRGTVEKSV
jgi:hypothetical protein